MRALVVQGVAGERVADFMPWATHLLAPRRDGPCVGDDRRAVLEVELVRDNPGQVHPEHRQSCGDTMSLHHSLRGAC